MILKQNGENYTISQLGSCFIFEENHVFIEEEDNSSEKVAIVEKELDGIGNLKD